tara:strand:- start:105 stop:281 length:177 start_codon:yes stop_codon:yes gene_type:complete
MVMQTLQEIKEIDKIIVNDENSGKKYKFNTETKESKPMFLEEQIRDNIPIDGEKDETV